MIYSQHFQLRYPPFGLTPDTRFYVELSQHQEALAVLKMALNDGEGFIKVTGEVGTGKTLLCRKLLQEAEPDWLIAWVPDPCLTPQELRRGLASELGLNAVRDLESPELQQLLQKQLIALSTQQRVILIIDEAQALPDDTLETLRLLTNLETEQRKLLQVVLFGQPELNTKLATYRFRQLRQRITFSYHLSCMSAGQIQEYLSIRLRRAGATKPLFNSFAISAIAQYSRGIPRLVNILAHKGLMLAYGEGRHKVNWRHIRYAAMDTEDVLLRPYRWLIATALLLLLLAGYGWSLR